MVALSRRTWEIIIGALKIVGEILKLYNDKIKNGGKKDDSTGSTEKK